MSIEKPQDPALRAADQPALLSKPRQPANSSSARAPSPAPELPKVVPFESLARCGDEVWIENEGQIYRLRRTRQGKLILTK